MKHKDVTLSDGTLWSVPVAVADELSFLSDKKDMEEEEEVKDMDEDKDKKDMGHEEEEKKDKKKKDMEKEKEDEEEEKKEDEDEDEKKEDEDEDEDKKDMEEKRFGKKDSKLVDRLLAKIDAQQSIIESLKTKKRDQMEEDKVTQRTKIITDAADVLGVKPSKLNEHSNITIKQKVVKRVFGKNCDGKTEDYLDAMYDLALENQGSHYTTLLDKAVDEDRVDGVANVPQDKLHKPSVDMSGNFEKRKNAWKKKYNAASSPEEEDKKETGGM